MSDLSRPEVRAQRAIAEYVAYYSDGSPREIDRMIRNQIDYVIGYIDQPEEILHMVRGILTRP